MSKKDLIKHTICVLVVVCLLVAGLIFGRDLLSKRQNNTSNNQQILATNPPVVTTVPTNLPVIVTAVPVIPPVATMVPTNPPVFATAVPTNPPVIVTTAPIVITPEPVIQVTATPEVWYIPTYVPATRAPATVPPVHAVITATPVPTATPEPVITATPVPTATPAPTATPEPTKVPVTAAPSKYTAEAFEVTRNELYKITADVNEILPDYNASRKYDLYSYIDFEKTDPYKLFEVLREIYVDTLAHSLDFKFDYGNSVQGIEMTLNSAYCSNCGKVKCIYDRQNDAKMATLLGNVSQNDIMNVNLLLLNFINSNSYASTENINERLIICCSCGN